MSNSVILTYGTFDLFHIGHVNLLKRLRELGDYLIVGCSTDDFNTQKGKSVILPFEQRVQVLKSCRYVDEVIEERSWDQKGSDIVKYQVDIFGMGDDWSGKFDYLSDIVKVVYLPRTKYISTTNIKQYVNSKYQENLNELSFAVDRLNSVIQKL